MAIVALVTTGAAAAPLTPSGPVTTTTEGWEHWFRLDWTAQHTAAGEEIVGYIYSNHGKGAVNVRVLAQGLDANGSVVGQKIEWVPGIVPGMDRTYFRVTGLPSARALPRHDLGLRLAEAVGSIRRPSWLGA